MFNSIVQCNIFATKPPKSLDFTRNFGGWFLLYHLIRLHNEKGTEVFSYLDRIEKSLKEQGFSASRAGSEDIKRIMAVYYEQNVTSEKFEDFDGERWIIPDD